MILPNLEPKKRSISKEHHPKANLFYELSDYAKQILYSFGLKSSRDATVRVLKAINSPITEFFDLSPFKTPIQQSM